MSIIEALKLIATQSAFVQHEAIKALRSRGQPQQIRYNIVAEQALADPQAEFTDEERVALLDLIVWPDGNARITVLAPIRVSESERAIVQARADAETGGNVSELVRRLLLG